MAYQMMCCAVAPQVKHVRVAGIDEFRLCGKEEKCIRAGDSLDAQGRDRLTDKGIESLPVERDHGGLARRRSGQHNVDHVQRAGRTGLA